VSPATILIVEDEPDIAEVLTYNLEREGMIVHVVERGDDAVGALEAHHPDLVVLDLMLPGMDGLEVARRIRSEPSTAEMPLVMLTAKAEEVDRIVGLELGADDYITKPFSPREAVLRIKAVLRRSSEGPGPTTAIEAGMIQMDIEGHRVEVGGESVELTATEFRLLQTLLEREDRVQTRDQLLSSVWGYSEDVDSRTVDTHIRRLRSKLGPASDQIETVIGVGYRLSP